MGAGSSSAKSASALLEAASAEDLAAEARGLDEAERARLLAALEGAVSNGDPAALKPFVLPAGNDRAGVETVEQAVSVLEQKERARKDGKAYEETGSGVTQWVEKIVKQCSAESNPAGYRTCKRTAATVIPFLVELALQCPRLRGKFLEASACLAAGSREAGEKLVRSLLERMAREGSTSASEANVLEVAFGKDDEGGWGEYSPVTDVLAALLACETVAQEDFGAAALEAFVPAIARYAAAEREGTPDFVQSMGVAVLAQLAAHQALKPAVAAALPLAFLRGLVGGPRAGAERFDVQLLCMNLLAETAADGGRVAELLEALVAAGAPAALVAALDAALDGAEYPVGSRCFRRPGPLVECIAAVARAGKAWRLRGARGALVRLLAEDPDLNATTLRGLLALAASRRCAEDMLADGALLTLLDQLSPANAEMSVVDLGAELLFDLKAKAEENPPVYEVDEFQELFGGRPAVQLFGPTVASDEQLGCADADKAVESLLESSILVWDGEAPAAARPTDDGPNLSTSFTQVIERVLRKTKNRERPLVAAGFCGAGVSAARSAWADLATAFPGQVVLFGSDRESVPVAASPEPSFESAGLGTGAPATVVSIGLTGAAKADFARIAGGEVRGSVSSWVVFPAMVRRPNGTDESLAEWGGMVLVERCVLSAATRQVDSASWTMTRDAGGEWQVEEKKNEEEEGKNAKRADLQKELDDIPRA